VKIGISLEEAQSLLLSKDRVVSQGMVSLSQAWGRILSRKIVSTENVPPFNRSPLDGYALKAIDTQGAKPDDSVKLEVIEEIRAGFVAKKSVVRGTAIKVMTGAPIPAGADVVIKYEDVERQGKVLSVFHPLQAGKNIVLVGEDVAQGDVVANKGDRLTPPLVGLLAAIGQSRIPVFNRVKVAIISTGDELVDPVKKLQSGKIYNSNIHSLAARCHEIGVEVLDFGIVPDEQEATAQRIRGALEKADLVITTGGVSVGDFDLVPMTLQQLEAHVLFWKVNMKPGAPMIAAQKDGKLIIGLSGNPAAALINFDLLVVPVIKKMMGCNHYLPTTIQAVLADEFSKNSVQRRLLRGKLEQTCDENQIHLTGNQSNGVLKSMIGCDVLIDVPAGSGSLVAGQKVTAILF
jgi:molybdopterin molybdotransferase